MIRYFAAHPTLANILMIAIILLGLAGLPTLNRETFPAIANRLVLVKVPYPGASPLDVEQGIGNLLEDATDGIGFMEEGQGQCRPHDVENARGGRHRALFGRHPLRRR